jgi:hypothetical protein
MRPAESENTRERKLIMRRTLLAIITGALLLSLAPAASAEETTCRGTFGAVTLDNVRVPEGARCTLNGTRVEGTIYVETRATLTATDVYVIGNVQAEGARSGTVRAGSYVGGSIQVVQGDSANVRSSEINGDILFDENDRALSARSNEIGGNLQAFQNTGGVSIVRNTIDGNLQCKENQPPPTGGGNIVQGNKEDQCASL